MLFILGIILGIALSTFLMILMEKYHIPIQRNFDQFINSPFIKGQPQGYFAGLSDEEQSVADAFSKTKDTKII